MVEPSPFFGLGEAWIGNGGMEDKTGTSKRECGAIERVEIHTFQLF